MYNLMKIKITTLLCLCILFVSNNLFAQSNTALTIFGGTIINPKKDFVKITLSSDGMITKSEYETHVNKDGSFKFSLNINTIQYGHFTHGDEYTKICLYPGDSINISIDTKQFDETIVYSGKGSEKNNYMAKEFLMFYDDIHQERTYNTLVDSTPESFNEYCEELFSKHSEFLDENLKDNTNVELFKKINKYNYVLNLLFFQINYFSYKRFVSGETGGVVSHEVKEEETYFNKLKRINLNDSTLIICEGYISLVWQIFNTKSGQLEIRSTPIVKDSKGNYKFQDSYVRFDRAYELEKLFLSGKVRDYVTFVELQNMIEYREVNQYSDSYFDFVNNCKNEQLVSDIKELYSAHQKLKNGKPAPNFELLDISGNKVKLSDFIGKVVYIDFWASWCGPCIGAFSDIEEVYNELKDEDFVFLYISIDDNKEKWKEAVSEYKLKGIHLNSPDGFESEICKLYLVSGIPKYMIIDKNGNIYDKDASYNNNKNLVKELKKALLKKSN